MASEHIATVKWQRNGQVFTDLKFSRHCDISYDGGITIAGSAAPTSVSPPYSDVTAVDPEELLVSALSTCHMMWFLAFAARDEYLVDSYVDNPVGLMEEVGPGRKGIVQITIHPKVEFSGDIIPDAETVLKLHEKAHEYCNIANSISAKVVIEPA